MIVPASRARWHTEQSAALPFRRTPSGLRILLITSRTTRRWVLPKGNVEAGMRPPDSAAREAWEEAGIGGRVGRTCCGVYTYVKRDDKKGRCIVRVFPLKVTAVHSDWPERRQRRREWVSPKTASARVREAGLSRILLAFARLDDAAGRQVESVSYGRVEATGRRNRLLRREN